MSGYSRTERRDRNRRRRWYTKVNQSGVTRGCRAWLLAISEWSDDAAKPVYGWQWKQARTIRCSTRTVRRYRAEAEHAKLIETKRGQFERRSDGTFGRGMTNIYTFCVPPAKSKGGHKSSSHRADIHDRSFPALKSSIKSFRQNDERKHARIPEPAKWHELCAGTRWIEAEDGVVAPCPCM